MKLILVRLAGGAAVVSAFFFGTLFLLDYVFFPPDYIRARDIKTVKIALDNYRAAKGHYPGPFSGNPLTDLRNDLVGGGFMSDIPRDPVNTPDWRYAYSGDGVAKYTIVVRLKYAAEKVPAGGACMTGVGVPASSSTPPPCPF